MIPETREQLNALIRKANRCPINRYLLIRAMKAIEGLTYDDVAMSDKEKVSAIYRMAHAALNKCNNNHEDWKHEIIQTHKAMVAIGVSNR